MARRNLRAKHDKYLDPKGPQDGKERVVRGGSWYDPEKFLRNSARDRKAPDKPVNTIGFRCVLPSLAEPK